MATDIERLHYYERQYLRASDFDAQQEYHRDALRRHLLGPHTWGIVTGLELTLDGTDVVIEEGLAVDAFGRTLVLLDRQRLGKDLFNLLPFQATSQWLTVSLRYAEESAGTPSPGFETCATGDDGYRTRETFRIDLATEQNPVTVAGTAVDPATVEPDGSLPYQDLPQDDRARWTVPLGQVQWQASADPTLPGSFLDVRTDGRQYAGAVAAGLLAPAGHVVLRDRSTPPLDPPRDELVAVEGSLGATGLVTAAAGLDVIGAVRVQLDAATAVTVGVVDPANPMGPLDTKFHVSADGDVTASGSLDLGGAAAVDGSLQIRDAHGGADPDFTLARAAPDPGRTDLQVTIGAANAGANRFVVSRNGAPAAEQFAVADSGATQVGGALTVNGAVALEGSLSIRDAAGGDDTDPLVVSRFRRAPNRNDLRIQIGDDLSGDDRLVVGPVFFGDGQFKEQFVVDNLGNVAIAGNLSVAGLSNLVVAHVEELSRRNAGDDQPFTWVSNHTGVFTAVYASFVVLNGFSIWSQPDVAGWGTPARWGHSASTQAIPQHAFVRITERALDHTAGIGFVSESLASNGGDNSALFTVVVLGKGT